MDTIRREMEEDAKEDANFCRAGRVERVFICFKRCMDVKKYCVISLLLALILTIQLVSLFPPASLSPEAAGAVGQMISSAWKRYSQGFAGAGNDTDKVVKLCMVAQVEELRLGDNSTHPPDADL